MKARDQATPPGLSSFGERISQKQAAEVAGVSSRQMRRLMKRVETEGTEALCIGDGESPRTGGLPTRPGRECWRCLRSTTPTMGRLGQ